MWMDGVKFRISVAAAAAAGCFVPYSYNSRNGFGRKRKKEKGNEGERKLIVIPGKIIHTMHTCREIDTSFFVKD